ncbi:MAG: NAD(P)/FAD-dependent oxidoreductase [Granulosicoccus sp.]
MGIAALAATKAVRAQSNMGRVSKPSVVVIGGGAGGATVARYIASGSNGQIDVTLVEANPVYNSCFFSNLYIGGFRSYESLTHSYDKLTSEWGIKLIHDTAIAIDRARKKVELNGGFLRYDILIMSPGIDFVQGSVQGWSETDAHRMPHAYKGGHQVQLLKTQIDSMPKGGVFAIVPPKGMYRCPPGPYERVSMVAHLLKVKNPSAKIIIADPKPVFSKMGLFREAWKKYYRGMIEMNSDVDMSTFSVDPNNMTITIEGESIKVDVCNVIPSQQAGKIAELAGVVENNWAPVHGQDMRSRIDDSIYILGDAARQGDMPKSGFSANSQAKVCANAILAKLIGSEQYQPKFNNTCWSLLAPDDAVKIGASYKAADEKIVKVSGFVSKRREAGELRKSNYQESLDWYQSTTTDMFG